MPKLKRKSKSIITSIVIVVTAVASFLIVRIINTLKNIQGNPADISYTSNTTEKVNYLVYLKNNNYLPQAYLDSTFSYLTNLVEYIKTDFSYQYNMDNYRSINYSYQINAKVTARSSEQNNLVANPIWQTEEVLLQPVQVNKSKLPINIKEQLNVSIAPYLEAATGFINTLGISASVNLDINLIVNINGKTIKNTDINKQHIVTMTIPLGVKAFDITISKNYDEKEVVYNKEQINKETGYMWAIIYIVILFIVVSSGIYLIKFIIDCNYSKYSLKKKKIIKEFDDRIVQVSRFIKYEKWEIIDIDSFEELLDLSNEAFEPIFFWERKINRTKEAWFCIIRDKVLYRYILKQM